MIIEIYTKSQCPLCDEAKEVLAQVRRRFPFELREVDITRDPALFEEYRYDIPVVFVNGRKAFKHRLDAKVVEARLRREVGPPA
ncbi:MAG TPA: glutaredoxin family protein [Myxococcaceae bacterium]|nr:glutaredoxin family protein [Myxococcaceae bacterium]